MHQKVLIRLKTCSLAPLDEIIVQVSSASQRVKNCEAISYETKSLSVARCKLSLQVNDLRGCNST